MTDFGFIRNDDLRSVIRRDYAELQGLNAEKQTKAVVVLAGALLEGLLVDALTVAGTWEFDGACQQNLSDMIRPAKAKGIIKDDNLSQVVKDYRHLVHPGREVRRRIRLTKEQANLARAAVDLTLQDILLWYESPSGKAAVALKLPTATVPPDRQRTFLRASDHSIDLRIADFSASTLLILVTNNSDETFDIAGADVELEGASLGGVARPKPGLPWIVPSGKGLDVRWPDPCHVMMNLVYRKGKFESFPPPVAIDIVFDCVLYDEPRQIKKRVVIQIDYMNKRAIQL